MTGIGPAKAFAVFDNLIARAQRSPTQTADTQYTVKPGDSFISIATATLHQALGYPPSDEQVMEYVYRMADSNGIDRDALDDDLYANPLIHPGDVIELPPVDAAQAQPAPEEPAADSGRDTVVDTSDGLDDTEALVLFSANFDSIDSDGNGQVSDGELEDFVTDPGAYRDSEAYQAAAHIHRQRGDGLHARLDFGAGRGDRDDGDISLEDVAHVLAAEQLPAGLSSQAQAAFITAQLAAVFRAAAERDLGTEDVDALLTQIFDDIPGNDPALAATLVRTAAANGAAPEWIADVLDRSTAMMTPADVDAVLQAVQPELAQAAAVRHADRGDDSDLVDQAYEERAVDRFYGALARVSDRAGDAGDAALAAALAPSFPDGDLERIDNALADAVEHGHGLGLVDALITALDGAGKTDGAASVTDALVDGVNAARGNAAEAQAELARHQAALDADLSAFGAALLPEERQAYIDAFWAQPQHNAALENARKADAVLATTLAGGALERAARAGNEDAAKALVEANALLANSTEHAAAALDFLVRLGNDEALLAVAEAALGDDLSERLSNEVLAPALASEQTRLFAEAFAQGADQAAVNGALDAFDRILADLNNVDDALDLQGDLAGLRDGIRLLREGNVVEAAALADRLAADELGSRFNGMLAATGLVLAGAEMIDQPSLEHFLKLAAPGVEATAYALNALAGIGLVSREASESFSKFAGRLLPGISLLLNGRQFLDELQALGNNGNAGDVIKLLGTGINIVGDIAGIVPVAGTAVDGVFTAVGTIIHGIGSFIDGLINGGRERAAVADDREAILTAAGIDEPLRAQLLGYPSLYAQLGTFGLDVGQVRVLGAEILQALDTAAETDNNRIEWIFHGLQIAAAHGLQGDQFVAFMRDVISAAATSDAQSWDLAPFAGPEPAGLDEQGIEDLQLRWQTWLQSNIPSLAGEWLLTLEQPPPDAFNAAFFLAFAAGSERPEGVS